MLTALASASRQGTADFIRAALALAFTPEQPRQPPRFPLTIGSLRSTPVAASLVRGALGMRRWPIGTQQIAWIIRMTQA